MKDDTEQLLRSLRLKRMLEVLDPELKRATKSKPSYEPFLARLLREEYLNKREQSLRYRVRRAGTPELLPFR